MANGNMNFKFGIGFNVDKTGISEIKKELQDLKNLTSKDFLKINPGTSMKDVSTELSNINYTATTVEKALESAFNPKLETVNFSTFNNYLKQAGISVQDVYTNFSKAGAQGQEAFRKVSSQVYSTNQQLEKTETFLDKMAVTLSNSLKWNLASRAINELSGNIQEAYGYVKDLDSSLNDIRIVTGQSSEQMETFAKQANKAAQALGQSTTAYTNASLIYYQQGLDNEEVAARTEVTLKAANVTGQSTDEVSEQLTAVWNGYQVSADEAEIYVDRLAAVAASTASDLEELSTGMSKVASSAAAMGVGEEQLAAQLATIISVTRQAPESVGTALIFRA